MDFVKLIDEVQKNDILYNTEHKDYNNIHKKNNVWQKIANKLNVEQDLCEQEWKNLQLTYEELKTDEFTEWEYYDLLRFIEPYYEPVVKKVKRSKPSTFAINHACTSMSDEMTRRLINEIKKHGCIFNSALPGYTDRDRRTSIWTLISKELDLDISVCKAKWKRLRESYKKRRMNKTAKGKTQKYKWRFYEDLDFLKNIELDLRDTKKNIYENSTTTATSLQDFDETPISTELEENEIEITSVEENDIDIFTSELVKVEETSFEDFKSVLDTPSTAASRQVVTKTEDCIRYENGKTVLYLGSPGDEDSSDSLSSVESYRKTKKIHHDTHEVSNFIDKTTKICNNSEDINNEKPDAISLLFTSLAMSIQQANLTHKQNLSLQRQTCDFVFRKIANYNAINKSLNNSD